MIKFCEDLANNGVVGRCYISNGADIKGTRDSTGLITRVNSLDVAYSEIHYTLFSKEGDAIGRFGCPIKQFTLFERASRYTVKKLKDKANSGTRLHKKVFPP